MDIGRGISCIHPQTRLDIDKNRFLPY